MGKDQLVGDNTAKPGLSLCRRISGKHQAQLFGWGNMWGNIGAGLMPLLFTAVLRAYDSNHDYHEGVWLCAIAFVIAGLFALGVNAEKLVVEEVAS